MGKVELCNYMSEALDQINRVLGSGLIKSTSTPSEQLWCLVWFFPFSTFFLEGNGQWVLIETLKRTATISQKYIISYLPFPIGPFFFFMAELLLQNRESQGQFPRRITWGILENKRCSSPKSNEIKISVNSSVVSDMQPGVRKPFLGPSPLRAQFYSSFLCDIKIYFL